MPFIIELTPCFKFSVALNFLSKKFISQDIAIPAPTTPTTGAPKNPATAPAAPIAAVVTDTFPIFTNTLLFFPIQLIALPTIIFCLSSSSFQLNCHIQRHFHFFLVLFSNISTLLVYDIQQ